MTKQSTEIPELLTVEEVAAILRVDDRTVYRKCENDEIPHFRIGGTGAIRFSKAKFLEWVEKQHQS